MLAKHFISFFCNEFNKSMNVVFYLSFDIKITLKSHFWRKNVIILLLCTHRCYGRHNVIAWCYFTLRRDVI